MRDDRISCQAHLEKTKFGGMLNGNNIISTIRYRSLMKCWSVEAELKICLEIKINCYYLPTKGLFPPCKRGINPYATRSARVIKHVITMGCFSIARAL